MTPNEAMRPCRACLNAIAGCLLAAVCVACGAREQSTNNLAKKEPARDNASLSGQAELEAVKETPPPRVTNLVWNTYHGGTTLEGVAPVHLPDTLTLRWRFTAQADVVNTPVAGDGRIFFSDVKGRVYAIDAAGNEIWSKTFEAGKRQDGTPILETFDAPLAWFHGTLVAGASNGVVYALDAATGEPKWKADLDGMILGTAAFLPNPESPEGGCVYVIEQSGGALHCLDFATGAPAWTSKGVARCDGSPSVGKDFVAFGSCAAALHVLSARDGSVLHEIPIDDDSQVAGGVAMAGDSLFSGSRSGKVLHANARTGQIVWMNQDAKDETFATPAVNADWVVIGTADGNVYGLERATGMKKWTFKTDGLPTSAVIAEDKVVVASDGTLFLLHLTDGTRAWSYEVGDTITSPAIVGELVIVGSDDGSVVAFGAVQDVSSSSSEGREP